MDHGSDGETRYPYRAVQRGAGLCMAQAVSLSSLTPAEDVTHPNVGRKALES